MSESFVLTGEPGSIRASATLWSSFAEAASGASADIKGLDTSEFEGDEADTYRSNVNEDLPPHLDTTATAWSMVATALNTYAGTLEELQSRMAGLQTKAADQAGAVSSAQHSLASAQSADKAHAASQQSAKNTLKPGETLPPDIYHGQTSGASSSLSGAQQALQDTIDAAATVRSQHTTAANACGDRIDEAKHLRFEKPPGFFGKLAESVGDWISEHADVLTAISSVLKTISGIAGLLALIPCLTPIMGPIALITGGAALVIDVGLKLATGEGSWLQIGVDALSMVPGMRAAKVAFAANTALTSYNVATGKASLADLVMVVGMGAISLRSAGAHGGGEGVHGSESVHGGAEGASGPARVPVNGPAHIEDPYQGQRVWRVYGENQDAGGNMTRTGSRPYGEPWTPADPAGSGNFRSDAGLPDENPGRFVVEGRLNDPSAVHTKRDALPLDGNPGGWPEYLINDAENSVQVVGVGGVNETWTHGPGGWSPPPTPGSP